MKRSVEVLVIPEEQGPAGVPRPGGRREVQAATTDGLRTTARAELEAEGYLVRAVSLSPDGMVAYVEERS